MIRHHRLEHRFVTSIPRQLEPGVLYISIECATAIHACCCGCGGEVVTPLAPTDWQLTFDGETVSLWPSIGNWNFPCRSHYVIERSEAMQALPWSDRRIAQGRFRDRIAKSRYYEASGNANPPELNGDGKTAQWDPRAKAVDGIHLKKPLSGE